MGGIKIVVGALLMLLAFATFVNGENKTWPDFSCLGEGSRSQIAQNMYDTHEMQKNDCAEAEKREVKGACAKVCYLKWNHIMHQYDGGNDPVTFEPEQFASQLQEVNNIRYYSKITQAFLLRMEKCKKDHPEIPGMWKHMRSPCKKWEAILNCFDKAIVRNTKFLDVPE